MSRILFAAARGARIQKWGCTIQKWFEVTDLFLMDEADGDRIHPDDAHLQYGPISTALRERSNERGNCSGGLGVMLALPFVSYHRRGSGKIKNELHRSLFLLILAEALADEGL